MSCCGTVGKRRRGAIAFHALGIVFKQSKNNILLRNHCRECSKVYVAMGLKRNTDEHKQRECQHERNLLTSHWHLSLDGGEESSKIFISHIVLLFSVESPTEVGSQNEQNDTKEPSTDAFFQLRFATSLDPPSTIEFSEQKAIKERKTRRVYESMKGIDDMKHFISKAFCSFCSPRFVGFLMNEPLTLFCFFLFYSLSLHPISVDCCRAQSIQR